MFTKTFFEKRLEGLNLLPVGCQRELLEVDCIATADSVVAAAAKSLGFKGTSIYSE